MPIKGENAFKSEQEIIPKDLNLNTMRTKIISLLALFCVAIVNAQTFTVDFILYEIISPTDNTVKTIDYDITGGTVVNIPSTVMNGGVTYSVIEIGAASFSGNGLTAVTIPTSVNTIGSTAFASNNLTTIDVPDGVPSIPNTAFFDNNLTSINLPNSITYIGLSAFRQNQLTNVVLPVGLVTIDADAFRENLITTVTIPNTVTTIGLQSFQLNSITSLTLPDSVTSIGSAAFSNNQIASLTLPTGLTSIPDNCFTTNQLTTVTIPNSVTSIGSNAFGFNLLNDVIIPENVTSIGTFTFNNNPLTSVTSLAVTPPTISTTGDSFDSFAADRSAIDLFIPAGTTGPYVTDAGALWTGFQSVTETGLSLTDLEIEQQIQVITNLEALTIIYDGALNFQELELYSLSGAKVAKAKSLVISTQQLSSGIYLLYLIFDKGTLTKKVIIQ